METFNEIQISIPLWEIVLLGVVSLLCLISERTKLGLLVTFVFVFYWGLIMNFSAEGSAIVGFRGFDALYLFFGMSVSMIFLVLMLFMPNDR